MGNRGVSPTLEEEIMSEIQVSEGQFVSRGTVLDDDPVAVAFEQSWNDESVLRIQTDDPATVVRKLRKFAKQTERGVRIQDHDDHVVFQAKEQRKRVAKK